MNLCAIMRRCIFFWSLGNREAACSLIRSAATVSYTHLDVYKRQEVARFIEHLKYARIIGADMVGTETGRLSSDFRVTPETYSEDGYQLLLKSMREIVSAAEKLGVIVGVEGVFDHTLYSCLLYTSRCV